MIEERIFTQGMNQDQDVRYIQNGQYIDSLNVRVVSTDNGRDGAVETVRSNTLKNEDSSTSSPYTMPDGINRCIGNIEDELNSRTFYFVWNSEGSHLILMYDQRSDQITEVVKDNDYSSVTTFSPTGSLSSGSVYESSSNSGVYGEAIVDVADLSTYSGAGGNSSFDNTYLILPIGDYLDFKEDYLIQSRLIQKDGETLLFWTDSYDEEGNERVRYINIERALGNSTRSYPPALKKNCFDVAPDSPLYRPIVSGNTDSGVEANFVRGKFFQFKYRYIGLDGQPSAWSPYSQIPLYNYNSLYTGTDANNRIEINVFGKYEYRQSEIWKIEIAARECSDGNSGDWHKIKEIDLIEKSPDATTSSSTWGISRGSDETPYIYQFLWYNNDEWTTYNIDEGGYDICFVPQFAKTLEILNDNRLSVANTGIGYSLLPIISNIETDSITLTATYTTNTVGGKTVAPERTFKKGVSYDVGIRYSDEKGRLTTVIIDKSNYNLQIEYPLNTGSCSHDDVVGIRVDLSHQPPTWAKSWQVVIRPSGNISYEDSTPDFIQFPLTTSVGATLNNLDSVYGVGGYQLMPLGCIQTWQADYINNENVTYLYTQGDAARLYRENGTPANPPSYLDAILASTLTTGGQIFGVLQLPSATNTLTASDVYEIYSTSETTSSIWYEMGQAKDCGYDTNGEWVHLGISNYDTSGVDQVYGATDATTIVSDADCYVGQFAYFQSSTYPPDNSSRTAVAIGTAPMECAWIDFAYNSRSNDRGRALPRVKVSKSDAIDGRYYTEARIHFSQSIVQETDRADFSLMYDLDFVDNNTQKGAIQYMYQLSSNLYIFQEDRIGYRPVARQIIEDLNSQQLVGISGEILGNINYLPYNFGISTNPESFAVYGGDMFCVDAKRNAVLRIRGNQIENIAANGMEFYFDAAFQAVRYYNKVAIYGGYDREFGEYVVSFNLSYELGNLTGQSYASTTYLFTDQGGYSGALFAGNQAIVNPPESFISGADVRYLDSSDGYMKTLNGSSISEDGVDIRVDGVPSGVSNIDTSSSRNSVIAYNKDTIAFSNKSNMWVSRYSFFPETIGSAQMRLATFKDGEMYVHNDPQTTTYNNFYGAYYGSTIKFPLNAVSGQNKLYNTIGLVGDSKWTGVITNYKGQETNFIISDLEELEGEYWANVLRDINTPNVTNAITQGDYLIDDHAIVELTLSQGTVTGVNITNAGTGYTSVPTVSFSGGGGSGAAAFAVINAVGNVIEIVMTNTGSGYTSAPTVSFSGGGGSGAAGGAVVSNGLANLFKVKSTFNVSPTVTVNG